MTLSIFPLTSVVLFPKLRVPLFIFEPRYREMIRDELAGDRLIGMATIPLEFAHQTAGDPPLYPIGCAGRLERCQRRDDGTFDIVLQGTSRFRIVEEKRLNADQLYRSARVEWLPDESVDSEADIIANLRLQVHDAMNALLERIAPEQVATLQGDPIRQLDDATYINTLCVSLDFSTPERQSLLEADRLAERYESMLTLVQFRIAQTQGSMPTDSNPMQ